MRWIALAIATLRLLVSGCTAHVPVRRYTWTPDSNLQQVDSSCHIEATKFEPIKEVRDASSGEILYIPEIVWSDDPPTLG
jgi:hypothetical protein